MQIDSLHSARRQMSVKLADGEVVGAALLRRAGGSREDDNVSEGGLEGSEPGRHG